MFLSKIYKFVMCRLSYYIMVYWCIKSIANYIRIERFYYFSHKFLQISDKYMSFSYSFFWERQGRIYIVWFFNFIVISSVWNIRKHHTLFFYTKYVIILLYHSSFPVYYILLKDNFNNIKKFESVYIVQKNVYKNVCVHMYM